MEAGEQSNLAQQDTSVKSERYVNDGFGDYKSLESIDRYDQCAFNTTVNCVLLQSTYVDPGNVLLKLSKRVWIYVIAENNVHQ